MSAKPIIDIRNLTARVSADPSKEILKGINLTVNAGEVHAIMGPNGSGKSTLAKIVAGHPAFEVTGGEVSYAINNKPANLLDLSPSERAREGVFLGFQYPVEVPGVTNLTFLHETYNTVCVHQGSPGMELEEFRAFLTPKLKDLDMNEAFLDRSVNAGFSGGEKKKNEILQMAVLRPRLALLDETDSGLDIDALKVVATGVNTLKNKYNGIVLVTHYQRLLDYISPDKVHVLYQGKIIKSGGKELALELEGKGYDWLIKEHQG
jgi:Fe-S cluster assembly ATP-binding protein